MLFGDRITIPKLNRIPSGSFEKSIKTAVFYIFSMNQLYQ